LLRNFDRPRFTGESIEVANICSDPQKAAACGIAALELSDVAPGGSTARAAPFQVAAPSTAGATARRRLFRWKASRTGASTA